MSNERNHLIGGITGGIGSSLAKVLIADGHTVAGFARDKEAKPIYTRKQ